MEKSNQETYLGDAVDKSGKIRANLKGMAPYFSTQNPGIISPEQLQQLVMTINPQLFLETLLCEIRGTTIKYCATKKKIKNEAKNLALHRLEVAEEASDAQPGSLELLDALVQAKTDVDTFEKNGALIRARMTWHIEGGNLAVISATWRILMHYKSKGKGCK